MERTAPKSVLTKAKSNVRCELPRLFDTIGFGTNEKLLKIIGTGKQSPYFGHRCVITLTIASSSLDKLLFADSVKKINDYGWS